MKYNLLRGSIRNNSSLHFIRFWNEYFLHGNYLKSLYISFALKCFYTVRWSTALNTGLEYKKSHSTSKLALKIPQNYVISYNISNELDHLSYKNIKNIKSCMTHFISFLKEAASSLQKLISKLFGKTTVLGKQGKHTALTCLKLSSFTVAKCINDKEACSRRLIKHQLLMKLILSAGC